MFFVFNVLVGAFFLWLAMLATRRVLRRQPFSLSPAYCTVVELFGMSTAVAWAMLVPPHWLGWLASVVALVGLLKWVTPARWAEIAAIVAISRIASLVFTLALVMLVV